MCMINTLKYGQEYNLNINIDFSTENYYVILLGKKNYVQDHYRCILLFCNLEFDISILGEIDKIKNSSEKNRLYFRKYIIKYKNEIIEVDADSLFVRKKSDTMSHIRMINYVNLGDDKNFMKSVKFSIANLLYVDMVSFVFMEQNHQINVHYFFDSVNSFGALLNNCKSLDNFILSEVSDIIS
jgi:hypothetical protein